MEEQAEGTIGPDTPGSVYTIGHSNHTLETFLGLLQSHHIEVLIDTRSSPFSRYAPHFNWDSVKAAHNHKNGVAPQAELNFFESLVEVAPDREWAD